MYSLPYLVRNLSLPDPPDALSQAHVIRLEFVEAPADQEDGGEVGPLADLAGDGYAPFGEVVGDT